MDKYEKELWGGVTKTDIEVWIGYERSHKITIELNKNGCQLRRGKGETIMYERIFLDKKALKQFFLILSLENIKKIMEED